MKTTLETLKSARIFFLNQLPEFRYFFRGKTLYKIGFADGSAVSETFYNEFLNLRVEADCSVEETPHGPLFTHEVVLEGLTDNLKEQLIQFPYHMALIPDLHHGFKLVGIYGGLKVMRSSVFEMVPGLWSLKLFGQSSRPFLPFQPSGSFLFRRKAQEEDMPLLSWGAVSLPLKAIEDFTLLPNTI